MATYPRARHLGKFPSQARISWGNVLFRERVQRRLSTPRRVDSLHHSRLTTTPFGIGWCSNQTPAQLLVDCISTPFCTYSHPCSSSPKLILCKSASHLDLPVAMSSYFRLNAKELRSANELSTFIVDQWRDLGSREVIERLKCSIESMLCHNANQPFWTIPCLNWDVQYDCKITPRKSSEKYG